MPHGGWVPRGRKAEDGVIDARYDGLQETESGNYAFRTRKNVEDSDGTLILTVGPPTGGTLTTVKCAEALGKPHLVLDLDEEPDPAVARAWIEAEHIAVLNVAGPRESKAPGVRVRAQAFVETLLSKPRPGRG